MIIRNNLASTPLRNHSVYFLGCLGLALVSIIFTFWNVTSYGSDRAEISNLQEKISEQRDRKNELQLQASGLQQKIRQIRTPEFEKRTEFINNAIKRRVFSWTTLLDQLENALSDNVKMVSVSPNIEDEQVFIDMEVAGKSLNDVTRLILTMENSPIFSEVSFRSESQGSDGLLHASISLQYLPDQVEKLRQKIEMEPARVVEK